MLSAEPYFKRQEFRIYEFSWREQWDLEACGEQKLKTQSILFP